MVFHILDDPCVLGGTAPSGTAHRITTQSLVYDGNIGSWFAKAPGITSTGVLAVSSYFAANGVTPAAPNTGYGTPTGGSVQGSFAAGSITLANLAAAVAQSIIDLKATGLIKA
jgi:hypothetical protein